MELGELEHALWHYLKRGGAGKIDRSDIQTSISSKIFCHAQIGKFVIIYHPTPNSRTTYMPHKFMKIPNYMALERKRDTKKVVGIEQALDELETLLKIACTGIFEQFAPSGALLVFDPPINLPN